MGRAQATGGGAADGLARAAAAAAAAGLVLEGKPATAAAQRPLVPPRAGRSGLPGGSAGRAGLAAPLLRRALQAHRRCAYPAEAAFLAVDQLRVADDLRDPLRGVRLQCAPGAQAVISRLRNA